MKINVDKMVEQRKLFNRIVYINNDLLQFLADFYNVDYEKDWNNKIKYEDSERVKKIVGSRFLIDDIKKVYSNEIPRKQYIWCGGFYGYYVHLEEIEKNVWDVIPQSNWDKIYSEVTRVLQLTHNIKGKKCYAILKALISDKNFRESACTYEMNKQLLITEAHKLLNYDETIRPWYGNIADLICTGLLFDTSSNKNRRVELPAELYLLATKIIEEYEKNLL